MLSNFKLNAVAVQHVSEDTSALWNLSLSQCFVSGGEISSVDSKQ